MKPLTDKTLFDIISWRGGFMKISYNKLWKQLIDKNMKKKDLQNMAGLSSSSIAKLGKNEVVTLEVLMKICEVLDCNIGDVVDFVKSNEVVR